MKKCTGCKLLLDESNFYKDRYKKDGYCCKCKNCLRMSIDKENRKIYEKNYWDKNRDRKRQITLKSFNKNKEHHKEIRKQYLATPAGIAAYKKQTANRYARSKIAFIEDVDIKKLYIEYGMKCFYCNKKISFKEMHVDHYIPIAKGGKHIKSNLRISCRHCNLSKGAKMPEEVCYQLV